MTSDLLDYETCLFCGNECTASQLVPVADIPEGKRLGCPECQQSVLLSSCYCHDGVVISNYLAIAANLRATHGKKTPANVRTIEKKHGAN